MRRENVTLILVAVVVIAAVVTTLVKIEREKFDADLPAHCSGVIVSKRIGKADGIGVMWFLEVEYPSGRLWHYVPENEYTSKNVGDTYP